MGLRERLEEDLKAALKAGRRNDVAALRLTLSEIKNAEKEARAPLDDEGVTGIIRSAVKKRKESITLFRQGGRGDLVEKEEAEVRLLEGYLPSSLSEGQLISLLEEGVRETGASSPADLGKLMKWVMPRLRGRADGSEVNRLARERLSQSA